MPDLGVGWAHGQACRFSQRGRTGDPDGSPCWPPPGASRARPAWPETAVGPPARPETRRLCPAGTAEASPGARFPSLFRVVPRRGRPFLSHGAVGPSRGLCAPLTLRRRPSAGRGGRGPPRSSPGGAPPALNGRLAGRRRHARVMESTSKMYEKIALDASKTIETIFGFFRVMPQIGLAEEDDERPTRLGASTRPVYIPSKTRR